MNQIVAPYNNTPSVLLGTDTAAQVKTALSVVGVRTDPSNQNVCVHDWNVIEGGLTRCVISGGGASNYPNLIGSTVRPKGTEAPDPTHPLWTEDVSYVTESAHVSTISGGYDNINNQLAGYCGGGGHNWLKWNAVGHSSIISGSFNLNAGARSIIGNGQINVIGQNALYAGIFCGIGCEVDTIGGQAMGSYGISRSRNSFAQGGGKKAFTGDTQRQPVVGGVVTANATATFLSNDIQFETGLGRIYSGQGTVRVNGIDAAGDMASYSQNFSYKLNDGGAVGARSTLIGPTGTKVTSDAPILNMVSTYDDIGCAALPHVRMTTGGIFVRVTGKAATTIAWSYEIILLENGILV